MPVHGMTHPPEMNLNGESGNLVWVRVPRTWVPLELKDSLEGIYAPMFGVGSRNVNVWGRFPQRHIRRRCRASGVGS